MKRQFLFTLLILTGIGLAFAASIDTYRVVDGVNLVIDTLNVDPTVVEPGDDFTLELKIYNTGTKSDELVTVKLTPKAFELKNPSDATKTIGYMAARGTFQSLYELRAPTDAVSGVHNMELSVCRSNTCTKTDIPISIKASPSIEISLAEKLGTIGPGESVSANITLENKGKGQAQNVKASITTTSLTSVKPTGVSSAHIKDLGVGESDTLKFDFAVESSATSGIYLIPIKIEYKDESNTNLNMTQHLGIEVGGEPDITVLLEETSLVIGKQSTVDLRIVNIGNDNADYVTAEFSGVDDLSPKQYYIGNLKPDDYDIVELTLTPPATMESGSEIEITTKLGYRNQKNEIKSSERTVKETVIKRAEDGAISQITPERIIIGILLLVIVITYTKKRKK